MVRSVNAIIRYPESRFATLRGSTAVAPESTLRSKGAGISCRFLESENRNSTDPKSNSRER